jgi:hypothetical protein
MEITLPEIILNKWDISFMISLGFIVLTLFFYKMLCSCECGALYHTEKEKKEFYNFLIGTFLIALLVFAVSIIWID